MSVATNWSSLRVPALFVPFHYYKIVASATTHVSTCSFVYAGTMISVRIYLCLYVYTCLYIALEAKFTDGYETAAAGACVLHLVIYTAVI